MKVKFLGPFLAISVALAIIPPMSAQDTGDTTDLSTYRGPGILSPGVGETGSRGGEQVNLRVYGGVSGVYDQNIQPFAVDSAGNLLKNIDAYGVELDFGAYGVHTFRHAQLGIDYRGDYRKYTNIGAYAGSDHSLSLGYTYQATRRLVFDLHESVGSVSVSNGYVASGATGDVNSAITPTSLLLDDRMNYTQSSAHATYLKSARSSFSGGGDVFLQTHKAAGQSKNWGYDLNGSFVHRVSKTTSVGVNYVHSHYETPDFFSTADANAAHGTLTVALPRAWSFSLEAGAFVSEVQGPVSIALDPTLAALFGQRVITVLAYRRNILPSGSMSLKRQFRNSSVTASYSRGLGAGNGAISSGRSEYAQIGFGYTGIRKISIGLSGYYNSLAGLSQISAKYKLYSVGGGVSYNVGHALNIVTRYDLRDQQIGTSGYSRTSSRATVGLLFSPGNLPLSLW